MRRTFREPGPAFLFFGVFSGSRRLLEEVRGRIEAEYGPLHPRGESEVFAFPETRTYRPSMGPDLLRKFYVVNTLWPQDGLAPVKRRAIDWEETIGTWGNPPRARPINIDPGLLNDCRVILASTKDHAHRLYRGSGVWEEITLMFREGGWRSLPWTYPDFRNPAYHAFFAELRKDLLERRRSSGGT